MIACTEDFIEEFIVFSRTLVVRVDLDLSEYLRTLEVYIAVGFVERNKMVGL